MNDGLIHFRCPICRARMAARAANAEQHVECPECSSTLAVPYESRRRPPGVDLYADEAALEFRSLRRGDEGELDMTPMVDVTFLLLIFFMVTAAFTMQKSFQLPAPQENAPSSQVRESAEDAGVITIRIDEYNTFHVSASSWDEEQEAPSEQELLRRLREAKQGDSRGQIANRLIVEAHGDATHARVVMAMDAGTEVGMEEITLRSVEDDDA